MHIQGPVADPSAPPHASSLTMDTKAGDYKRRGRAKPGLGLKKTRRERAGALDYKYPDKISKIMYIYV